MNEANLYAPPETDVRQSVAGETGGRRLGPDEARRLYNHSRSIGALVFLWCLGLPAMLALCIPLVLAGAKRPGGHTDSAMVFVVIVICMGVLMLAGIIGCWRRDSWGRTVGYILCSLMLLNFWLGTLIGIFGLISLTKGGRLFGPDRLTHRHLKETVAAYKAGARNRRR